MSPAEVSHDRAEVFAGHARELWRRALFEKERSARGSDSTRYQGLLGEALLVAVLALYEQGRTK